MGLLIGLAQLLGSLVLKCIYLRLGDDGCGLTIEFANGFLAGIRNVTFGPLERKAIDSSHTQTEEGWQTFFPGCLKNPGELTIDVIHNPDQEPPIDDDEETVKVSWPVPAGKTNAAKWECKGFMISYEATGPHDDLMTAKTVVKFSGKPTFTAAT